MQSARQEERAAAEQRFATRLEQERARMPVRDRWAVHTRSLRALGVGFMCQPSPALSA